jgi:hypothetical protein
MIIIVLTTIQLCDLYNKYSDIDNFRWCLWCWGAQVDFGHMEALRLLSSSEYQEKQIGYMALGMLLHEQHELIPLIINSCKVDLDS